MGVLSFDKGLVISISIRYFIVTARRDFFGYSFECSGRKFVFSEYYYCYHFTLRLEFRETL